MNHRFDLTENLWRAIVTENVTAQKFSMKIIKTQKNPVDGKLVFFSRDQSGIKSLSGKRLRKGVLRGLEAIHQDIWLNDPKDTE